MSAAHKPAASVLAEPSEAGAANGLVLVVCHDIFD
jgi:hypothetical protein